MLFALLSAKLVPTNI
uniref:Uncharacterized protein n=1 Tax=Arundo donax TaxID=35708 RepID=A0A0A9GPI1_ARUDO